jgi:hypothetical protein
MTPAQAASRYMKQLSLLSMAAVCLTMTAHADVIDDHSSFAHELNSGRWLKISLSEKDANYEEDFCQTLKRISAEENVQFSRPVKANGDGDPGTLFVLLSTPTAQNKDIEVHIHSTYLYLEAFDRSDCQLQETQVTWDDGLPYNNR